MLAFYLNFISFNVIFQKDGSLRIVVLSVIESVAFETLNVDPDNLLVLLRFKIADSIGRGPT